MGVGVGGGGGSHQLPLMWPRTCMKASTASVFLGYQNEPNISSNMHVIPSIPDLGIGAHITGGLKCDGCGRLHAVVTAITGVCSDELHEGLCVRFYYMWGI